jgi:hypothetical protein
MSPISGQSASFQVKTVTLKRLLLSYVQRHTQHYSNIIETHNLYSYREPMSPHLAAQLAPDLVRHLYKNTLACSSQTSLLSLSQKTITSSSAPSKNTSTQPIPPFPVNPVPYTSKQPVVSTPQLSMLHIPNPLSSDPSVSQHY